MSWLRLDDDMLDHPKWVRAIRDGGSNALHLWLRLCSWCSRHLTDGEIPPDIVPTLIPPSWRAREREKALLALESSQLVTIEKPGQSHVATRGEPGTVRIVDYLERNPSRAETIEKRERQAQHQKNHALRKKLSTQHPLAAPDDQAPPESAPSRSRPDPVPIPRRDPERAPELEVPKVEPGGVARTYSMPSEQPPQTYLDEATMAGIRAEQAHSTWKHYWGAGLPAQGVEKLHPWLCQRALERAVQQARAPKGEPRKTDADLDTTSAANAFRPSTDHERFCTEQGLDLGLAVKLYRASPEHGRVGFAESERRFLARLKCWAATGTFHADGPLPKPKRTPGNSAGGKEAA